MGHVKAAPKAPKTKAVDQAVKFQSFGFLADHYPQMAKQALAIQAKGTKATKSEAAKLRSLAGWNTRYAKKAGFISMPVPEELHYNKGIGSGAVHVKVAAKPISMAKPKPAPVRAIVEDAGPDFDGFDVVQLRLTGSTSKTDPDYSPGAPVVGQSHYIVLKQKNHRHTSSEVVLLHPFSLTRFTIPEMSFKRALLSESLITPKQALTAIEKRMALDVQLKRETPLYVGKIQAALRKAVA